jgi:hypothetical protein
MLRPVIASTVLRCRRVASSRECVVHPGRWPDQLRVDRQLHLRATDADREGRHHRGPSKDDIPHGIASSNNAFKRSQALDTDDSYSFTFTTPGTYQYFCYLYPHMVGSIVVEATTSSNATQ